MAGTVGCVVPVSALNTSRLVADLAHGDVGTELTGSVGKHVVGVGATLADVVEAESAGSSARGRDAGVVREGVAGVAGLAAGRVGTGAGLAVGVGAEVASAVG